MYDLGDVAHQEVQPKGITSDEIFYVSLLTNVLAVKDDSLQTGRIVLSIVWWGREE